MSIQIEYTYISTQWHKCWDKNNKLSDQVSLLTSNSHNSLIWIKEATGYKLSQLVDLD